MVPYPLLLKEHGYRTGFIGKYGCEMEVKPQEMFDYYKEILPGHYFLDTPEGEKHHETDVCADGVINFIQTNPKNQPFCMSVSFNAVHAKDRDKSPGMCHYPWSPSTNGMYEDVMIPVPKLNDSEIYQNQSEFLKESLNRERYFWRWDTPEKYQENMRAYFRMISGVDNTIGSACTKQSAGLYRALRSFTFLVPCLP